MKRLVPYPEGRRLRLRNYSSRNLLSQGAMGQKGTQLQRAPGYVFQIRNRLFVWSFCLKLEPYRTLTKATSCNYVYCTRPSPSSITHFAVCKYIRVIKLAALTQYLRKNRDHLPPDAPFSRIRQVSSSPRHRRLRILRGLHRQVHGRLLEGGGHGEARVQGREAEAGATAGGTVSS